MRKHLIPSVAAGFCVMMLSPAATAQPTDNRGGSIALHHPNRETIRSGYEIHHQRYRTGHPKQSASVQ